MGYEIKSMRETLACNSYPGRGIVIGKSADGKKAMYAYFIMGRSENSRNRIFVEEGENVTIYPYDESKVEDPSLIIYSPVKRVKEDIIVTNGDQTDTVEQFLNMGKGFRCALKTRCFEPDAPNYTPRISGILHLDGEYSYEMSILKSADGKGVKCNRYAFDFEPVDGLGHFIHTYMQDGNPLPTFEGEPERVSIPDDAQSFVKEIWESLNEDNKISLVVCSVELATGQSERIVINKYSR